MAAQTQAFGIQCNFFYFYFLGKAVVDLSSLPLQVLLHLNVWYFIVFWIAELLIYAYKGVILPFPNEGSTLALEIILMFLFAFIEAVRLFFGYKGNLAERKLALIFSIVLTIPVLFLALFLMLWQTYVLRIEFILCSILLVFCGLEFFISLATFFVFQRHESFVAR
ncbi:transmembrane protein 216-like [Dendronephthya gigantea]|uniref:transmembrane protein 216-like n=1 Tax=Dendronephthya gigantea TaxID=151771 RepID=UPI00106DAE1B|nr:transmembrane protein 216-like [Dendronephthya gigantea]